MPGSIQQLLVQDAARLAVMLGLDSGTARIEVQILLRHVLKVSRASLLAHPERCLTDQEQARYHELLLRRLRGEPLAYLLGEREFFGLIFKVTPATLIPRPETELLVELALRHVPQMHPAPQASDRTTSHSTRRQSRQVAGYPACAGGSLFRVLDLGTGCGAIALSIAHARPDAEVVAVEASAAALVVAHENAHQLNIANIVFEPGNWFEPLDMQRFDLIVSNPPYVAAGDPHLLQGDLPFEPLSALASGVDGLEDIRRIVSNAPAHLNPGGWLMFEHGYDQAVTVRNLLREAGLLEVFSVRDLAGIERVSGGRFA
ncbi:MAG: peptide chain release factor N(5)-glutamine methyltransferase [Gallionellaceae bacterium]